MDARDIIKQKKAKTVFLALNNNRFHTQDGVDPADIDASGCLSGSSTINYKFNSYKEKEEYQQGKKQCCNCRSIN